MPALRVALLGAMTTFATTMSGVVTLVHASCAAPANTATVVAITCVLGRLVRMDPAPGCLRDMQKPFLRRAGPSRPPAALGTSFARREREMAASWVGCLLVPLVLAGDHIASGSGTGSKSSEPGEALFRQAYYAFLGACVTAAVVYAARIAWNTAASPPWWDMRALWMYGRVADAGLDPYLPSAYHTLAGPGPFPQDFGPELLDVGCVYPPPSLLLFGIIGWLPLRPAAAVWMTIQTAASVGAIVLLWRTFLADFGRRGLALAATLTLTFPPSQWTLHLGQINFLALLFIAAAWRSRERAASGAYVVGATLIKPVYFVLLAYAILRRDRRTLVVALLSGAAICVLTLAVFGPGVFRSYIENNPVTHALPRLGPAYFTEITNRNQSLLAWVLRLVPYHPARGLVTQDPLYLALAGAVAVLAAWAITRAHRAADGGELSFAILLTTGLIIYPWTLTHYFTTLIAPLLYLWTRRRTRLATAVVVGALITGVFVVLQYHEGNIGILACAAVWIALIARSMRSDRRPLPAAPQHAHIRLHLSTGAQ